MRGDDIRRVREAVGMLQPEFAQQIGMHPVTLSRFERDRDPISMTVELAVYELATRLGVREVLPEPKTNIKKIATKKKGK